MLEQANYEKKSANNKVIFKTDLKRMNTNGPNSVSANRLLRGPKPEGLNNELTSLP